MMPQQQITLVPRVEWRSCGIALPPEEKFVWVVTGRVIECGEARRYERQVHMGVYKGNLQFQVYPFELPVCSEQVWAWAPIVPPDRPVCKQSVESYHGDLPEIEDDFSIDIDEDDEDD
jgi:hypothetical protein